MVNKYGYKLKPLIIIITLFVLTNGYLFYLMSRYIVNNTISSLIVLIVNEIFIIVGILYYLLFEMKIDFEVRLKELEYFNKEEKRKSKKNINIYGDKN